MRLHLFLNELSIPQEKVSKYRAVQLLKNLVSTIRTARQIDPRLVLNSQTPIHDLPLGRGISVAMIRNDGECIEESQFLKALEDRSPLRKIFEEIRGQDPLEFEYKLPDTAAIHGGEEAEALGLAHLLEGMGISILSHPFWDMTSILLERYSIDEDDNLQMEVVATKNACTVAHVEEYGREFGERLRPEFRDGTELWRDRAELLPNLKFIPRTQAQIECILSGDPRLGAIWRKLFAMDRAVSLWRKLGSPYPQFPFGVRPESTRRRNLVVFRDENGLEHTFSDHADFTPGEGRIHFIVMAEPQRHAVVGHVGRKLGIG